MNDRREIRRSSPDSPQGFVPVLTVFAGLIMVVVVAGLNFVGSRSDSSKPVEDDAAVAPDSVAEKGPTTVVPSTTLIRGATTTTLFVTTTTPITTTTSTTTTTLPGPALEAGDAEVVFGPGETSVSFKLRSSDPDGIAFEITGVPRGFSVSPTSGTVAQGSSVTVTVRLTDPDSARSGTLTIQGDDGSRATVRVKVDAPDIAISSVRLQPSQPVCNATTRIVVTVSGEDIERVKARVDVDGKRVDLTLSRSGNNSFTGQIPGGPAGATMSGTVTAVGGNSRSVSKLFSVTIGSGPDCPD